MDIFSPFHLIILLVIVVLLFGTGKLTKIGPDLGNAVRGFKKALHGDEADGAKPTAAATQEQLKADPPASADNVRQESHDSAESK